MVGCPDHHGTPVLLHSVVGGGGRDYFTVALIFIDDHHFPLVVIHAISSFEQVVTIGKKTLKQSQAVLNQIRKLYLFNKILNKIGSKGWQKNAETITPNFK